MKISQNQIDILKSLKCQRLKDDETLVLFYQSRIAQSITKAF
jgi:hypothetical protein